MGDNIEKDFQAPKQLGMRWIHFLNEDGLYTKSNEKDINSVKYMKDLIGKLGVLFP